MRVVVLVPYRANDARRRQLWDWTRPFLRELDWPIFEGDDEREPFSRAASMNVAARAAGDWDVALLADADTVQDVRAAHASVEIAAKRGAIIPWAHRAKLSPEGTLKLVRQGPEAVCACDEDRRDHTRRHGSGGTIMVGRDAWESIGGMDEKFRGYGNEDLALRLLLERLVLDDAIPWMPGTIWHLYHQPVHRVGTSLAAVEPNRRRWLEYRAARDDPRRLRQLAGA